MQMKEMEMLSDDFVSELNIIISLQKRFGCSMDMASEAYKCAKRFINENAICDRKAKYGCNCQ